MNELWCVIFTVHLTVRSYHVTYVFKSESTLCSCLIVKKLIPETMRETWSLSDFNGIRTINHLISKRLLNHLTNLAKWLNWVVRTYL